jgi:uncharacterized protein YggE
MKNKLNILVAALLMTVLLAACGQTSQTTQAVQNQTNQRLLNVTGTGKVLTTPDIAYINIGVHTQEDDVTTALSKNNEQAKAVSESLKGFGVETKDIQTSSFNVYPQQQYGTQGEMLGTKYVVDNTVTVTVRDLTQIGKILDAVVKSGANNINSIQFDVADKTKITSDARNAAMADAKKQADELAVASGATLGDVQSIAVISSGTVYADNKIAGGAMMDTAAVPVSAGQMTITVQVSVSYELK